MYLKGGYCRMVLYFSYLNFTIVKVYNGAQHIQHSKRLHSGCDTCATTFNGFET